MLFSVAAIPTTALAQAPAPPFDSAIDVQTFEYAAGPKTFVTVADGDTAPRGQLAVDALFTFLTKPFQIYDVDPNNRDMTTGTRTTVVSSVSAAQITAAYGLSDRLQLGVNLPIIFAMRGDGLEAETGQADPNGLNVTGLGDAIVEAKYRLARAGIFRASVLGGLGLPTSVGSSGSKFIGDDLPSARAKLAAQLASGRFALGANVGGIFRKPRTIYDSTIGHQLTWGAAAAVRVTDRFSLIGEGYGRVGLPDRATDASPLEVEGALRIYATNSVTVLLGGGAGVLNGIGSPEARFFVSLGYTPDVRDSDGDGIPNSRDKCPDAAEDKDGVRDEDGCPDDDNDGDFRPDAVDKCPMVPEDLDGFEDDDGCPELDNDGDGIADLQDKCPLEKEDGKPAFPADGCPADKRDSDGDGLPDLVDPCPLGEEDVDDFEDGDGCPDEDNDGDGVPDAQDKCPMCPEDKDGFEDTDGCPDFDNDKDGIDDAKDKCPLDPETINSVADDDGCPDSGGVELVTLDGDRLVVERAPTLTGRNLSRAGEIIVDQLAHVMRAHPEVTEWLVAVAQPAANDAKRLADAVGARLVAKGVPAGVFTVVGAAGPPRIGGLVRERANADTPLACPANLRPIPRPGLSKPAAPATPPPLTVPSSPGPASGAASTAPPASTPPAPAAPSAAPAPNAADAAGEPAPAAKPAKPAKAKPAKRAKKPAKPAPDDGIEME